MKKNKQAILQRKAAKRALKTARRKPIRAAKLQERRDAHSKAMAEAFEEMKTKLVKDWERQFNDK